MHTGSTEQFNEQHRITFENLSINRVILDKENKALNLLQCSPFLTLINQHLNVQYFVMSKLVVGYIIQSTIYL
jgi:hypothetical protein